jgi:hypothetical protein
MDDGTLVVRSVGDQPLEEGMAQLSAGIALAQAYYEETGTPADLLFDMMESGESKSSAELKQVADYLARLLPPLSGRIALAAREDLMFGLSRVFSAQAAPQGIVSHVARSREDAMAWLKAV